MDIYSAIKPVLWRLDPERAHHLALWALARNLVPAAAEPDDPRLSVTVLGRRFANPIGLAAGFDKDARVWRQAGRLGFGFVEVGSVTPRPQSGNPRPRLFRLDRGPRGHQPHGLQQRAASRRWRARLAARRDAARGILGINLGKNKETEDAAADYEIGARRLGPARRLPGHQRLLAEHARPARAAGQGAAGGADRAHPWRAGRGVRAPTRRRCCSRSRPT